MRRRVAMVWEDFQSASAIAHLVGERRSRRIRRKGDGGGRRGADGEREREVAGHGDVWMRREAGGGMTNTIK